MFLDITSQERQYLLNTLSEALHDAMIETNRTDGLDFREELRKHMRMIDSLRLKVERAYEEEETLRPEAL